MTMALLLGLGGIVNAQEEAAEKNGEVMILFTSDIHCGVDQGFGLVGLKQIRDNLEAQGYTTILVDDGDAIQGEIIGTISRGEGMIELMNAMHYDVAIPGNHEFDYGMERFLELTEKAEFPYISCNFNKEGELVFAPYTILEAAGLKIAFVGVTTPRSITSSTPVYFQNEEGEYIYGFMQDESGEKLYQAVQSAVDAARAEGADYVYVMGHIGMKPNDAPWRYDNIIENTTGIDVFLDGHSHDIEQVVMKNKDGKDVVRSACGTKLGCIGYSHLSAENGVEETGIWTWNNRISAPELMGIQNDMNAHLDLAMQAVSAQMDVVVGKTPYVLTINDPTEVDAAGSPIRIVRRSETNLGDFVADAVLAMTDADVAIMNGGGIRVSIEKGDITKREVMNVLPFGNTICTIEATGQQILDALEWGSRAVPEQSGGFLQVAGMSYEINMAVPNPCKSDENGMMTGIEGARRVRNVKIGEEPIDPEKTYSVAGIDYILLLKGDGMTAFDGAKVLDEDIMLDNQTFFGYLDLIGGEIGDAYADPYGQGRIVIVDEPEAETEKSAEGEDAAANPVDDKTPSQEAAPPADDKTASQEAEKPAPYTDFVVLSTTDMHGKCWEKNVLTDAAERNNLLRASSAVNQFRKEFGEENVLLVDNGDLFQGTPVSQVQLLDYAAGRSKDPLVMALCLAEMKYDAFVLGNHEFNYPWEVMSPTYQYLQENGVPVLAANAVYDGSSPEHERGENAFTPYIIKTVTIGGHEHKIGLLGLENTDITRWDLPVNYPELQFVHPGNENWSEAYEAQLYIPKMKEEGCEFIIVACHTALGNAEGEITFGINSENQGERIIKGTEGIDMLILGHDHSAGYSNSYVTDLSGKEVLIVNGGGQNLTKTVFRFSEGPSGALTYEVQESKNLSLGNYEVDKALEEKVQPYAQMAMDKVNMPVGTAAGDWDLSKEYYTRQNDSMDTVNKAVIEVTTARMEEKYGKEGVSGTGVKDLDHLDVDMAFTSVTVSGSYIIKPGDISVKDIYRLYRYANNILVLPMKGSEIKAVLEENASKRLTARVYGGKVYFYSSGDNFTNVLSGGLNFVYDMSKPEGERVVIDGFSNGRKFEEDALYLVAVNNYLLGNEKCGLRNFSMDDAVWSQLTDADVEVVQDMIAEYIENVCADGGVLTPELFDWKWEMIYSADPAALLPYEGETAAVMAEALEDGHRYVLYNESESSTFNAKPTDGGLEAEQWTAYGDILTGPAPEAAVILTAHAEKDGNWSFTDAQGRYLTAVKGGGLKLTEEIGADNLSVWALEPLEGGFHVITVGDSNEYRKRALEYYYGHITTYYVADAGLYLFNFYESRTRIQDLN